MPKLLCTLLLQADKFEAAKLAKSRARASTGSQGPEEIRRRAAEIVGAVFAAGGDMEDDQGAPGLLCLLWFAIALGC